MKVCFRRFLMSVFFCCFSYHASAERPENPILKFGLHGSGYPYSGDVCRRAGSTEETYNYIDHTIILVICPNSSDLTNWLQKEYDAEIIKSYPDHSLLAVPRDFSIWIQIRHIFIDIFRPE